MSAGFFFGVGVVTAVIAAGMTLWFVLRLLGRVFDRPRIPRAPGTYVFVLVLGLALAALSVASLGVANVMATHVRVNGPTRLGALQCASGAGGRARATLTMAGAPAATDDDVGAYCRVSGRLVTLRNLPPRDGIPYVQVTRLGRVPVANPAEPWWDGALALPMRMFVRHIAEVEVTAAPGPSKPRAVVATPTALMLENAGG